MVTRTNQQEIKQAVTRSVITPFVNLIKAHKPMIGLYWELDSTISYKGLHGRIKKKKNSNSLKNSYSFSFFFLLT